MSEPPVDESESREGSRLQGTSPPLATAKQRAAAMRQAFDYRGDVTIHTRNGRVIQGYVFDCRQDGPEPYVRLMPTDGTARLDIPYTDIRQLVFSGRDTAAGKSWEAWVKRYQEKRARGEAVSLDPDPLD